MRVSSKYILDENQKMRIVGTGEFHVFYHYGLTDEDKEQWFDNQQNMYNVRRGRGEDAKWMSFKGPLDLRVRQWDSGPENQEYVRFVEVIHEDDVWIQIAVTQLPAPHENPDPRPLEVPLDVRQMPSLQDEMRRVVYEVLAAQRAHSGEEFDEIDDEDFEIDPSEELRSPYEIGEVHLVPEDRPDYSVDPEVPAAPSEDQAQPESVT